MDFPHRLYDLRKQAGLSQEELAGLLGVTRQAVQKWEAGSARPDMDNLTALARYFNVTLDWLITGQQPASPEQGPVSQTVINNYYNAWHYEYKSQRTLFGLPLVHIHLGRGLQRAHGIIAIGNVATGLVAFGVFTAGLLSIGCVSAGLLALGCVAFGLGALGCIAIGILSMGCISLGWLAVGGIAHGVYAVGGLANGTAIAVGAVASAPLAIGEEPTGALTLLTDGSVPRSAIQAAIEQALSGSGWLSDLLTTLATHIHSAPLN